MVNRVLGRPLRSVETRTDWRRRPLSGPPLEYALDDVRYLGPIRDELQARLEQLNRTSWLDEELAAWQDEIEQAISQERWQRVSGNSGLDRRSLAIVRELWRLAATPKPSNRRLPPAACCATI